MKKIVLILALTAALPTLANANNLVTNGSFEANAQGNGSWSVYSALTGWTLASGPGIELRNNVAGTASDGVNYVELDSYGNSSIYQIITTTLGADYELYFDYSARISQLANTNGIEAYWNNDKLTTVTAKGGSINNWNTLSFNVTGTGNDKLTFKAVGISDQLGGNIDNISLTAVDVQVSSVPEPSTYALFLAGLGLLGVSARRRLF
ncbi:MAG: PEP-CTERM sorting domain-containing protein [Methylophilaceae bacterium]|nr:PEP-CTERM sorting domain-containing protein [Methylophilaceae bacterium]